MKKLTTADFIKKAKQVHGDKYDYSKVVYTLSRNHIAIICPIHGEFMQSPNSHLMGNECEKCSYTKRADNLCRYKDPKQIILDCYEKLKEQRRPYTQKDVANELNWNIHYVKKHFKCIKGSIEKIKATNMNPVIRLISDPFLNVSIILF